MAKQRSKIMQYSLWGVGVAVVLIILHFVGILKPVESLIVRGFAPIGSFLYQRGGSVSESVSTLFSLRSIAQENDELRNNQEKLEAELGELKEVRYENELLRKQIGFSENQPLETTPALVVGADPSTILQAITIDKGEKDGITLGKPALSSTGILIGKVTEVNSRTSKVTLLTDSSSAIVGISQDSRATGLIKGELGLAFNMTTIAQDKDIKQGERIVTAGMEENIPKGLVIGEVEEVIAKDSELFKEAKIKPLTSYKAIEMVFVVK